MKWLESLRKNAYYSEKRIILLHGNTLDILSLLPDESIDCIITSPPYWGLRDYRVKNQIGLEPNLEEYFEKLLVVTAELKRILKKQGIMFWNHGDSYCGSQGHFNAKNPKAREGKLISDWKNYSKKCLYLQNYRLILKMIDEQSWILRNIIIWYKPNHMPSSVKDRFTNTYEPIFMLVKNRKYWFDLDVVRLPYKEVSLERLKRGVSEQNKYFISNDPKLIQGLNRPRLNIKFNYHVRDAKKKAGICPQFKLTETEQIALKYGYDPEGIYPICKRSWKRHASPQSKDRKEGLKREFIPCKTKIPQEQAENFGSPRARYYRGYINEKEDLLGKNPGDFWVIPTQPFPEAHFAIFPEKLIEPMIKVGCPQNGIVLDPFVGSGTTCVVARNLQRYCIGIDIKKEYLEMAKKRLKQRVLF